MNETKKTLFFVILAALLAAAAFLSRPVIEEFKSEEMIGKQLFPKFTDPLAVKTLAIIKLDSNGERADFRIAEVGGVWSIPSHDNYPADAKDQMAKSAEALVNLTVLDVVNPASETGDVNALQTMYGVLDPSNVSEAQKDGAGVKITLGGENNEQLVDLIIGKTAAKTKENAMSPPDSELRYVRVSNQQQIYVAGIDPKRFPTDFDRWIEKNLLDISTFDIKQIFVDEYSFKIEIGLGQKGIQETLAPEFKGDTTLDYNANETGAGKWKIAKLMTFKGQNLQYIERQPEPDKELNAETLDSMVSALNDLKIVSVLRKPNELAKSLREGKPFEKIEMDASMKKTGFYLVGISDLKGDKNKTKLSLLSNEGDIQLRMKDGIRYNLRFGDLTGTESEINKDKEDDQAAKDGGDLKTADKSADKTEMGQNRYLFITAEFDPSMIAKAETKAVPDVPQDGKPEEIEKAKKEKEEIEKANKREQERYDAEVENGKKRAEKLSARFADWYYVIPEDVYKKIHLTDANIFQAKKKEEVPEPAAVPKVENKADQMPDLPGIKADGE